MKQFLRASSIFLLIVSILFGNPAVAFASEGDGGHGLEAEVNGYHVTLASQNEWAKGRNTIIVTLTDDMGMPVSDADVEILLAAKSDGHEEMEVAAHSAESAHSSMAGMEVDDHGPSEPTTHEEEGTEPIAMQESHEHGTYIAETHIELAGEYEVQVFFHIHGEMLQADFAVAAPGTVSKTIVLWGFALVNVGLVTFAGILRRQSIPVKGIQ
jgi:hypothetical protein